MDKKFGYYIVLGMLIGAIFGSGIGAANGSAILGVGGGALAGVFIGWFVAAAVSQKQIEKKENK